MKKVIIISLLAIFISSCGNKQSKATHAQVETPKRQPHINTPM